MKIIISNNIKSALPSYIIFNLIFSFLSGFLAFNFLKSNYIFPSDIGGIIIISIFSLMYVLSIILFYFLNQKYIPILLKVHPIFLLFLYLLSYQFCNHGYDGILIPWFVYSLPIMILILIHSLIIIIIGKKSGWILKN